MVICNGLLTNRKSWQRIIYDGVTDYWQLGSIFATIIPIVIWLSFDLSWCYCCAASVSFVADTFYSTWNLCDEHRRNTPSARVPPVTALIGGSLYLFAQFPTPTRVLLSRGLSGGSSKPSTHCSRPAFEATFDKLQLITTTLIFKMIKTL